MTLDERRKYLHKMKPRYHQATRSQRSAPKPTKMKRTRAEKGV